MKVFKYDDYAKAWQRVDELYRRLSEAVTSNQDARLAQLERSWIKATGEETRKGLLGRGLNSKIGAHPMDAAQMYTELGALAPPEITLFLQECYVSYLKDRGTSSLEEAFFGKPRRRAGNHAGRSAIQSHDFRLWLEIGIIGESAGISEPRAADLVASQNGEDTDAMLRRLRRKQTTDK